MVIDVSGSIEELASAVCEGEMGDAFCLTVVVPEHPWSLAEIVARLGGQPSAVRSPVVAADDEDLWNDEDQADDSTATYLISEQSGRWVIVELNGYQGERPEVQRALSRGASVYTQFEGMNSSTFVHSRDGVRLVGFDQVHPEGRHGHNPDVLGTDLEPMLEAARDETASLQIAAVGLLLRRTGVVLDHTWWHGQHHVLTAPELPQDPPAPLTPLQAALATAPRAVLGPVLLYAVQRAAHVTVIADDAVTRRALEAVQGVLAGSSRPDGTPDPAAMDRLDSARTALVRFEMALHQAFSPPDSGDLVLRQNRGRPGAPPMEDDPVWHRMQAGTAVGSLLDWVRRPNDPWPPPDEVLLHVRHATRHDWPELEQDLILRLTEHREIASPPGDLGGFGN